MVDGPDCLLPSTTSFRPTSILVVPLLMTICIHFKILMSKFSSFSFASRKHYQCQCQEVLDQYQTNLGLSRPLVGMHVRWGERALNLSFFVRQIIYITQSLVNYQANWQNRHRSFVCQSLAHCKIHKSSPSLVEVFTMCPKIIYWRWLVKCHVCDYMQC